MSDEIRARLDMAGSSPYAIDEVFRGQIVDGAVPEFLIIRDYSGIWRLLKLDGDPTRDTEGHGLDYSEVENVEWKILT